MLTRDPRFSELPDPDEPHGFDGLDMTVAVLVLTWALLFLALAAAWRYPAVREAVQAAPLWLADVVRAVLPGGGGR